MIPAEEMRQKLMEAMEKGTISDEGMKRGAVHTAMILVPMFQVLLDIREVLLSIEKHLKGSDIDMEKVRKAVADALE